MTLATIKNLIIRIGVEERTGRGIRKVTTELREVSREADNADRRSGRLGSTLSKLGAISGGGLARLGSAAFAASKGIAVLGAAAGGLNTIVQAGTALAPLTGLLLLLPGAAAGAAAAFGTLKLATSGVGDALKQAFSASPTAPKKLAADLKNLTPAARSFVVELSKMRPALDYIKNSAQQALFAPLVGQIKGVVTNLKGPLASGVATVGQQFGLAGRQVAMFLRQSLTASVVRDLFLRVALAIHQMLPALQPVLAGFRNLADLGTSFLPQIAAGASTVAQRFGVWLQQITASGKAAQWIRDALATLRQIGTVAVNVGGILKSVFSAASAAGSGAIGVLGQALARLNAFLKTAQGQQALTAIFQGLAAIGQALGPIIAALVTQLGALAKPIGQLAVQLGPILLTAINALGPAIKTLAPGLQALLGGLGQAFTALAPALVPLGKAIAQIGIVIGPLLPIVGRLVSQLVQGLAPILGQLFTALGPLIGAILQLAGALTPLIPPIAQVIVQLVQGLVPALTPIIGIVGQIVRVVGGFLVKALQMLAPVIVRILPIISQLAQTQGRQLLIVFTALAPALLQILQALLPLLPAIAQLVPVWARLLTAVTPLLVLLIQVASAILNLVLPVLVSLATYLIGTFAKTLNRVVGIVAAVINGIVRFFRWLYDVLLGHSIIPDIVNGMIRWFGSLPGRVGRFFFDMARGAVNQVAGLLRYLGGLPAAIGRIFSRAGSWLVGAGRAVVYGLWNGIASLGQWLFNRVWAWVKAVIPGPVKWALGIASPSKVMAGLGVNVGEGLAAGVLASAGRVRTAAGVLARAAVPTGMHATAVAAGVTAAGVAAPRGVAQTAAAPGGRTVLEFRSDGSRYAEFLVNELRKAVRVKGGGNVQVALGGTT